ncbi:hypothetical protein GCM10028807_23220 [Spirosoma daeguense]
MKTYSTTRTRELWFLTNVLTVSLFTGLLSCSQSSQPTNGPTQRLRVEVGEIKEVSLPARGDGSSELIGASDNQEVVEVSRQQLAPPVDTLRRDTTKPTVFQIKGVTAGTANVVFSARPLNQSGAGQPIRTYVVRVVAK